MRLSLFRKWFGLEKRSPVRQKAGRCRPLLELLEDRVTPAVHDLTTVMNYATIQAAVNAANPGDTILADAGTYAENVTINKSLILEGAQHGVDARTRSGAESIVDGTTNGGKTPFYVTASNVTIDGFTVQGATNVNVFGYGILLGAGTSGSKVVNDIVQNNIAGLSLANTPGGHQTVIQFDLFQNNNVPGPASGTGIYTDEFNAGGNLDNVLIDSNTFTNNQNEAVVLGPTTDNSFPGTTPKDTHVTISNNDMNGNGGGVFISSASSSAVTGNSITNSTAGGDAIFIGGGVNGLIISENNISGNGGAAVNVGPDVSGGFGFFAQANTNVNVFLNSITNNTNGGVQITAGRYTGTLNASGNWWNTTLGTTPTNSTPDLGQISALVSGPVHVGSFLNSGANTATVGFTPASTTEMWVPQTKAITGNTVVDGNIQDGINTALGGMTVRVAADTYAENVIINKSVDLKGAQAGQNANTRFAAFTTGANGPKADPTVETVLTAPTNNPLGGNPNADDLIRVLANNITIDGLVIDGNNPALGSSTLTSNGVNIHARRGIQNSDANNNFVDVNNLLVENNIIQNIAQRGIELSNDGTSSTGNLITANLVRNFGSDPVNGGVGIILFTNAYADVTNNTIVDTVGAGLATGLQLQNFYSNGTMTWSGNNITVAQDDIGIIANLFYASSATLNINNNTVNAATGVTGTDGITWGIYVLSVQVGSTVSLSNNTVGATGGQFARGIDLWNLPTTNTVSISGGTVANSLVGIELDSVDPYFGGASDNTTVNVSNVAITGGTEGVFVDAEPLTNTSLLQPPSNGGNPNVVNGNVTLNLSGGSITGATTGVLVQTVSAGTFTAQAQISGGATISAGTTGLKIDGANASLVGNTLNNTSFSGQSGNYITLANAADGGPITIDATGVTFDSKGGSVGTTTLSQFYGIEDKITDYLDDPTLGYVKLKSGNVYVAHSSESANAGAIQRGITVASSGDIVNVQAGTYNELVQVTKSVILRGAQFGVDARTRGVVSETIVTNSTGDFQIEADNVTIDGFTLEGVTSDPNINSASLGAAIWTNPGFSGTHGGTLIFNNIITGNIAGIELDNDGTLQTKVQFNLIENNTAAGAGSGNGIEVDFGLANAVIDNNKFVNNPNGAASLFIGGASINVTNNVADSQIYLASATSGTISGNAITSSAAGGVVLGGDSGLSIINNEVNGVASGFSAFRLRNDVGANSSLTVTKNKCIGGAGAYGVRPGLGSFTGILTLTDNQISGGLAAVQNDDASLAIDASLNYWGTSNAATVSASILGAGAGNVDFTPLINNGDTSPLIGFQADHSSLTVHTLGAQTGATGRITEAIGLLADGSLIGGARIVRVDNGSYTENVDASVKAMTLDAGAGPGQVTLTGNFNLSSIDTLAVDINGSTAGTGYDQWIVNGTVTLNGATLAAAGTRTAHDGDVLVLIKNNGLGAVSGTFLSLPEGSLVVVNGVTYEITYKYNSNTSTFGNGQDVALIDISGSISPAPGTAKLVTDPSNPSQKALVIVGTGHNDSIEVERDDHSSRVEVEIDSRHFDLEKSFAISSFDRIIIYGLNGDDHIEVGNNVAAPAVIFTGSGDNEVQAGGGPTIIVGGGGENHFEGGRSNDILIAGSDKGHLEAGRGNDILIAGTTAYDHNLLALCQIMSVWQNTTNANYNAQVSLLQTGTYKLDATTVHANGDANHLDGSDSARDWFFANLDGIGDHGVKDKITDLRANEVVTHITL